MEFRNREEAGVRLAQELLGNKMVKQVSKGDVLVLAIPRGGVVIGKVVADKLGCELGLIVTKKIGAPGHEELAVGAMGPGGEIVWDERLLSSLGLRREDLTDQIQKVKFKIQNYNSKFKVKDYDLRDKVVILVDDGIATGRTIESAIRYLKTKSEKLKFLIVAVPVCAKNTAEILRTMVDEWVCLLRPPAGGFGSVGQFYREFEQVSDEEVEELLISNYPNF